MIYHEYLPTPYLRNFIKCFWTIDSITPSTDLQLIVPEIQSEIIFHLGDKVQKVKKGVTECPSRSFILGQLTEPHFMKPLGHIRILGVRFHPYTSHLFLKTPATLLLNNLTPLEDIYGKNASYLQEKVLNSKSISEAVKHLEFFFTKLLLFRQPMSKDVLVKRAINIIVTNYRHFNSAELANDLNVSQRHLQKAFIDIVGVSPSHFVRLLRFHYVFPLLKKRFYHKKLTRLALDAGYYDQAHFIRDFKEFAKTTPLQFLKNSHQLVDIFHSEHNNIDILRNKGL